MRSSEAAMQTHRSRAVYSERLLTCSEVAVCSSSRAICSMLRI